jgi:RNA polymerase sigma-70 factor (ECF subfamily)
VREVARNELESLQSGVRESVDDPSMSAEELLLACLRDGDESAWLEFIRRFNPLIASVVLRVARQWGQASPDVVDDLLQETYLKLCERRFYLLKQFRSGHQDAIFGFIKVFAANLAQDHFKAGHAQKRGGSAETSSLGVDVVAAEATRKEPEAATLDRSLLLGQVAACVKTVAAGANAERDCAIFWLYYRAGLPASAIASLPTVRLSTKGVESTILRLTRAVRQELTAPKQKDASTGKAVEGIRPAESL